MVSTAQAEPRTATGPKLLPSPPLPEPSSSVATRQPLTSSVHHINTPPSTSSSPGLVQNRNATPGPSRNIAGPSRAEAYASAHQPRRSKEALAVEEKGKSRATAGTGTGRARESSGDIKDKWNHSYHHMNGSGGGSKPIFDWISRKLGAGRRASVADTNSAVTATMTGGRTRNDGAVRIVAADGRINKYTSLPRKVRVGGIGGSEEVKPPVPTRPKVDTNARAGPSTNIPPNRYLSKSTKPKTPTRSTAPSRLPVPPPGTANNLRPRLSPTNIFPQTPARDSILSRTESHSLHAYSLFSASPSERERRREANNPYPSMPIQMYKGSMMSSSASAWASASGLGDRSVSFRTRSRSRSPSGRSGRSIGSSLRPRISIAEEEERSTGPGEEMDDDKIGTQDRGFDDDGNIPTPTGADENASIRPIPPSHPPSPTPSQSMLSRSASGSLLSPRPYRSRSLNSPRRPLSAGYQSSSSISEGYRDDESGRMRDALSRRDSASTKPTTIISFDSGNGVGHIAQVITPPSTTALPPPPPPIVTNWGGVGTSSSSATAFAAGLPPPPMGHNASLSGSPVSATLHSSPLRTSFSQDNSYTLSYNPNIATPTSSPPVDTPFQAQPPKHSHPHPIHNPRPSSPPNDNASMMTLASSTFAAPHSYAYTTGTGSTHRPTSISRLSIISNYGGGPSVPPSANTIPRPGLGTSPSVTFAPILTSTSDSGLPSAPFSHPIRPTSLAPSHRSEDSRPPGSPMPVGEKEYPPSLHPTLGTRGSASISHASWGWGAGRMGGVDEGASTRAVRRRGSGSSMGSLESRWSWRGGVVSPVGGERGGGGGGGVAGRRVSEVTGVAAVVEELKLGDRESVKRGSVII